MTEVEQTTPSTGYLSQVGEAGKTVQTGIVTSLKGVDAIEAEIVSLGACRT